MNNNALVIPQLITDTYLILYTKEDVCYLMIQV